MDLPRSMLSLRKASRSTDSYPIPKNRIVTVRIVRGAHLHHGFDYRGHSPRDAKSMHAFLPTLPDAGLPALLLVAGNVTAAEI